MTRRAVDNVRGVPDRAYDAEAAEKPHHENPRTTLGIV